MSKVEQEKKEYGAMNLTSNDTKQPTGNGRLFLCAEPLKKFSFLKPLHQHFSSLHQSNCWVYFW